VEKHAQHRREHRQKMPYAIAWRTFNVAMGVWGGSIDLQQQQILPAKRRPPPEARTPPMTEF
jgi:hypothetical protein